jgi:mono/diheme cytochrome c family protein
MADFDGIKEAEKGKKRMPLGMTALFLGLLVFGLAYLYLFMPATTGWTQMKQYERAEQPSGSEKGPAQPAAGAAGDEARIAQGKAVYAAECAMCHGEKLEGSGAAPALIGPKFIYGAALEDHVKVITNGTQNGMPKYAQQLGAEKIRSVALFIHSRHKH